MVPILLVSDDEKKVASFIHEFVKKHKIAKPYIFEIEPKNKEITIDQIREIKKSIIFDFSDPQLFILYRFDTASYPAQNAFLKTLEEHNVNVHFILVTEQYRHLASTVLSRSKLVLLTKKKSFRENLELSKELQAFLDDKNLQLLANRYFQVKQRVSPLEIFDEIGAFFRKRLPTDYHAANILKEILQLRFVVENNYVNPQFAIDHLLIFIQKTYEKSTR
ncbi:hypothetical protein HYT33_04240 [Candidatus Roizmanbacteria bacterium]|nr:hypothetical protein [Candidatus Roizmanbacteria bacterium]